ncbi:CAMK family protein kinase [Tritrichomonas foetus]|uniref:CAMK family protein kinase n=1 Tax=Tritrichomonas foetus TaxID=1144522 RepID=A0A1J4JM82_9EUKA|nr:CAMK family protein kinase [Tritrichomonas foetus]|eukprot:OHS99801.1 CAMK family protein kinase [Tritrichomonas foetus]
MESESIQTGDVIHGYRFDRVIGRGGYASVWQVTSTRFNLIFVAKVVVPQKNNIERAWKSFDAEVQALLKLDHANIIRLYDHFTENNLFFLILEMCSKGNLVDEINDCRVLKRVRLMSVTRQLLGAIKYAHSNKVAHRDIKPQNILFDDFGRVKLADFGISIFLNDGEDSIVRKFECSPLFSAPEVLCGENHDIFKADIWSLGITLIYAATGTVPFRNHDKAKMIKDMRFLNFNFTRKDIPEIIFQLIKKMVVYDPNKRISIDEAYDIFNSAPGSVSTVLSDNVKFPTLRNNPIVPLQDTIMSGRVNELCIKKSIVTKRKMGGSFHHIGRVRSISPIFSNQLAHGDKKLSGQENSKISENLA